MNIRAKFVCETVLKDSSNETVKLRAVTCDGSKDNESWSKWTPSGELTMSVSNPAAHGAFVPGKSYFIDISPVET